ncbi:MAG: Flp family type IVb pilin [Planctomycetaceae bacterium]
MRRAIARVSAQIAALRLETGATAVEYALMLALIAMVVFGAVMFLGQSVNNVFANFHIP